MPGCVVVNWPIVGLALALTAPRLLAEWRNGWHSSTDEEAVSDD